jgi:undecaprenyl diphosphate synthase
MKIPYHVAIIMDGNGRWAKKRGLPRTAGHKKGVDRVKEIIREAKKMGVGVLTVFAFSTENWNRPKKEIKFLFSYLDKFLDIYGKEMKEEDMRLKVIGRRDRLSKATVKKIRDLEEETRNNQSLLLNIALDYGGKWDIVNAARGIVRDFGRKAIAFGDIDEGLFSSYLAMSGIAEPDLLIRTSGEHRISNFLIWHAAYSEFYFTPVLWPDFDKVEFHKAIREYSQRVRRFGKADE